MVILDNTKNGKNYVISITITVYKIGNKPRLSVSKSSYCQHKCNGPIENAVL